MNRYFIFAGETFYPEGGGLDYIAAAESLEDAKGLARTALDKNDWAHIFDTKEKSVVFELSGPNVLNQLKV